MKVVLSQKNDDIYYCCHSNAMVFLFCPHLGIPLNIGGIKFHIMQFSAKYRIIIKILSIGWDQIDDVRTDFTSTNLYHIFIVVVVVEI